MRPIKDSTVERLARMNHEVIGTLPPAPDGYMWQRGGECGVEQTTNWVYLVATNRNHFALWLCAYSSSWYAGIFNAEGGYKLARDEHETFVATLLVRRRLGLYDAT